MLDDEARRALTTLVRESGRDVLATLARTTGDLQLAEDAVQDAMVTALEVWPRVGVPPNPVAWLRLTARRRAIDLLRREARRGMKEDGAVRLGAQLGGGAWPDPEALADAALHEPEAAIVDDDLLRLVLVCCHPALALETQVALALHTLCGLSTAEVGRALLVPEATMAKRITRARQKVRRAGIPFAVPSAAELPARWAGAVAVAYLIFNEGYAATAGPDVVRAPLVDDALRLARLLRRVRPADPSAAGLLALMLLHDSRRDARVDGAGTGVLLADQDRSRWDRRQIAEAVPLVLEALQRTASEPDRYVIQAAIAVCHATAPSWGDTDWAAIVAWYDVLLSIDDGPVVRLNRAAAVAERDGAAAALALVDEIDGLQQYALWHASRAVLLRRLGRDADAEDAERTASGLSMNDGLRRRLSGAAPTETRATDGVADTPPAACPTSPQ
ncbi:MAG: RNA polymerase sigma factor [Dermatophilaceae bacterium]